MALLHHCVLNNGVYRIRTPWSIQDIGYARKVQMIVHQTEPCSRFVLYMCNMRSKNLAWKRAALLSTVIKLGVYTEDPNARKAHSL